MNAWKRRTGRAAILLALLTATMAAGAEPQPATAGRRVHIAEGMWSQHWRLPDALKGWELSESFLCSRYGFACSLKGFPKTREELLAQRVLVLANVPADALPREGSFDKMQDVAGRSAVWIREFVERGGGLFVLGGNYSLGTGDALWTDNPKLSDQDRAASQAFAEILPVEIHKGDIVLEKQNKPVSLAPVGDHPILKGLDWREKPVTLFYHEVAPKPGAQVLVQAGEAPVLVVGTFGKGRVAVWTATLHGEPAKDLPAYWRWAGWPQLVQNVTAWIAEADRGGPP